jgi:hypothetical protein
MAKRLLRIGVRDAARQRKEAAHGHRQARLDLEALRDVADLQTGSARDGAGCRRFEADEGADERGFARAVRPDDGHDLARLDGEIHILQDHEVTLADAKAAGGEKCHAARS